MKNVCFTIMLFAVVLMFFTGCDVTQTIPSNDETPNSQYPNIDYDEGIYKVRFWERPIKIDPDFVGSYTNKDAAISIACRRFEQLVQSSDYTKKTYKDHVLQSIFLDTEDDVWVVYFWPEYEPGSGIVLLGGGVYIAIYKQTGEVLDIAFSE